MSVVSEIVSKTEDQINEVTDCLSELVEKEIRAYMGNQPYKCTCEECGEDMDLDISLDNDLDMIVKVPVCQCQEEEITLEPPTKASE